MRASKPTESRWSIILGEVKHPGHTEEPIPDNNKLAGPGDTYITMAELLSETVAGLVRDITPGYHRPGHVNTGME